MQAAMTSLSSGGGGPTTNKQTTINLIHYRYLVSITPPLLNWN